MGPKEETHNDRSMIDDSANKKLSFVFLLLLNGGDTLPELADRPAVHGGDYYRDTSAGLRVSEMAACRLAVMPVTDRFGGWFVPVYVEIAFLRHR
jgi:hypothetical protein